MLPDISVYPAHTCIRKHYESEAYNMELFDILQTAEEVSGIDMKAVLQAMGSGRAAMPLSYCIAMQSGFTRRRTEVEA